MHNIIAVIIFLLFFLYFNTLDFIFFDNYIWMYAYTYNQFVDPRLRFGRLVFSFIPFYMVMIITVHI